MRLSHFFVYAVIGMLVEYFLRLVFPAYPIVLVPELLIFLCVIDFHSKNILTKLLLSAVAYDFWIGQWAGVVTISLLMTFFVLYVITRFSYLSSRNMRGRVFGTHFPGLIIFSEILFLVYYLCINSLNKIFLTFPVTAKIGTIQWHALPGPLIISTLVFILLYSGYGFLRRRI